MMAATTEVHHLAPRCLLRLHAEAEGELRLAGVGAWLEFELEAQRWGVDVEIAREDLEELVARSTVVLDRATHRLIHESDWQRWGRRGGLEVLKRYGRGHFSLLARHRWGDAEASRELSARVALRREILPDGSGDAFGRRGG